MADRSRAGASADAASAGLSGLQRIPVDRVVPSPFQPRTESGAGSLAQLAESIKQSGVIQPIVVRVVDGGGGAATYELVAGERRWRASRLAGMSVIPAVVRELTDEQAAEWALVENIQREDLNPMERGRALAALVSRFGLTQEEVGRKVAMERSSVTNLIRLTELEPEIQELLSKGAIGMGHGKALLGVQPGPKRVALAQRAAKDGWTVRMLETHARGAKPVEDPTAEGLQSGNGRVQSGDSAEDGRRVALEDLEKQIGDALGTKVRISTDKTGTRGSMTIRFYGLEHFDGLVAKMGVELK
ncbi:MAG: ParB/RepB/Spo0J family partition protein [Phycisphaerales bacterium JB037]